MLFVPAKSPDGSSRPARGTNPHKHKTEWGGVHQSEPRLHTRSMQVHEETVNTQGEVILQDQGAGSLQLCW